MPHRRKIIEETETGREGFALIAVLWLSGLIAVMAAGFAISARIHILTHAAALHGQQLEDAADGLTRLTGFRLAAEADSFLVEPGSPKGCRWNATTNAEIYVQDQSGLIDINAASLDLLELLVAGTGIAPERAKDIAIAIGDFRDVDGVDMSGGSEPETYPSMSFGPKNAPFDAIEELDQIPGMTEPLYRALLPHVTIYSLQAGFDPAVMSPALKKLLGFGASGEAPASLAGMLLVSAKRVYGVDVRVTTNSGARYRRMSIVTLEGQPDRPFFINTWQRGGDFEMAVTSSEPCFETN